MDIVLELRLKNEILQLHCTNESCDTDYTLYAIDKNDVEYNLVYSYDENWNKYVEEHPNDVYTGEAWIYLIKNSIPDYIEYVDENGIRIREDYLSVIEVKNTDILW